MNEVVGRGRVYDDDPGRVYVPRHSTSDDRISIHFHTDQGSPGIHGVELPQGTEQIDRRRDDRHRDARARRDRRRDDYEKARDAIDAIRLSDDARKRLHDALDAEEEEEERREREEEHREDGRRDEGREGHGYSIERDGRRLRLRSDEPVGMNYGDLPETDKRRDRRPARDAAAIIGRGANSRLSSRPDILKAYDAVGNQARADLDRIMGRR